MLSNNPVDVNPPYSNLPQVQVEKPPMPPQNTKFSQPGTKFRSKRSPIFLVIGIGAVFLIISMIIASVVWQSNRMVTQKTESSSQASTGTGDGVINNPFYITSIGVENATASFKPESYYDEKNQKTYVVWSGATTDQNSKNIGHKTSAMHVFIKYYDHKTSLWSPAKKIFEPVNKELYGDGHYRQGVLVDNQGYVHVFQTYHISLRPEGSTLKVNIRHAISKNPNSIDSWTVSDIPNTEYNTHGFYFKSKSGNLYGIYRKTYLSAVVGSENFLEEQWMIKSKDASGKNFEVWNAISPDKRVTQEVYPGETSPRNARWVTAALTGYKVDNQRNGVHMIVAFTGVRATFLKEFYYVFFNFNDDSFYCANGTKLGKSINESNHTILKQNCVMIDYGRSIYGSNIVENMHVDSDPSGNLVVYIASADPLKNNPNDIYITEYSFNKNTNKWTANKLTSIGNVFKFFDISIVSPTQKYMVVLTPPAKATPLPGAGDTWVVKWDSSSNKWTKYYKVTHPSYFYPENQVRMFSFTVNQEKELSGFFVNFSKRNLQLPSWQIFGYYDGYVDTKLFWFKINGGSDTLKPPVCSKLNWPTTIPKNGSGDFSIKASDPDNIAGSRVPDVKFYITKKMNNYCVTPDSNNLTTGLAINGRWEQFGSTLNTFGDRVTQRLDNTKLNLPAGKYMVTANLIDNDNQFTTGNPGGLYSNSGSTGCGYVYNSCSAEIEIKDDASNCTQGTSYCQGNTLYTCNAQGSGYKNSTCSNGYICQEGNFQCVKLPNLTSSKTITIKAKGAVHEGVWPKLELSIKESGTYKPVKTFDINSAKFTDFFFTHTKAFNASQVRLKFTNDKGPRDVWVDSIKFGNVVYPTASEYTYSTGTWSAVTKTCTPGFVGGAGYSQKNLLACNGYFEYFSGITADSVLIGDPPPPTDPPSDPGQGSGTNLITNGDFAGGLTTWSYAVGNTAQVTTEAEAVKINITNPSGNMQLMQLGTRLEANKTYRVSFDARSNNGRGINAIQVLRNSAPYTMYGKVNGPSSLPTNQLQNYSYTFTTSGFSGATTDTRFRFWLAGAQKGTTYWIDNVKLEKTD